ncbi:MULTISPECIES: hypothetical protein [unclassified Paenibacillus]|uniref:hypothetical protein n=1 Tax=unclassified Paenibacillus TaxID=185978 RepID=UPI001C103507|nr:MULTISPECIES: hypothetical protein [unclassified Paenibacillus]MBU5442124.1 hypothetical protein [Paenibacillus sp. MSJ-34]CAH0117559.1 hypothetical protein PAE9249_00018 [Paenibacillus sp. CECT 9249]
MISEEQLDAYRQAGTKIRVVRDILERNDVIGIVVAWDDEHALIRRQNRRVVQVKRTYLFQPFDEERQNPII